jgi:hypothetical protein
MSTTIESLELEVKQNGSSAVQGIDALSASLTRLKDATKGGMGLNSVANQIRNLSTALNSMDASSADKITKLANSLEKLKGLGSLKISSSIGNQLKNIGSAASSLNGVDFSGVAQVSNALGSLGNIGKATGLQSAITQLNKLPELAKTLKAMDWTTFTTQIQQLSNALAPLANQLNAISAAFNNLPANIRRLVQSTDTLRRANERTEKSYVNLWAKARMAMNTVRMAANVIAGWITQSNKYVEDLNLFTVALGDGAEAAKEFAERVSDIMGIDPADWLRNQGVFNTIIKGFGVANDRALIMSKNLTQLGYDISSFYNISVEDAFQKLQSGIAGELEPLRRLGYDLSVARLQQEAYRLGINRTVQSMTQAEKSELRYYAIMTQVTDAQGDMARTLNAPANQLRVLQAQVTQCARALGNIFIPALNAVLPYAIALAKVIRMIADAIASLFGFALPEIDYSGISAGAGAVADAAEATEDGLGGAAKAAKKLKNNLLGIDELNIISPDDENGGGGGAGAGIGGGGGGLDFELPEYDFLGDLVASKVDDIVNMIKGALSEIEAVISGFALAIGTILVVTGANIPLGLGLMAVGAIGLASVIAANWNSMSDRLARVLTLITGILGGFLLAIGAFLVFSGVNVPLGAALMVAGAVALATAATINWKFLHGDLKNALSILTTIVSGALLAMGALFAFTGVDVPLGIALMAAGAIGLVTAAGLNWDFLSSPMKKAVGALEAIVGGALLAFGALLALSGANIPLGIGLIAAGAVSLVAAVALNWDAITGDLKGSISTITAIVSGALIGIGAVLAFTGVATPLGIAMIAAGAVGLIATASLNWNAITEKVKGVLKEIGIAVGAALLAVGAVLAFTGVALPLGIALMAAGAVSLVAGVALNWDTITSKIKEVLKNIGIAAGAALLAIGLILALTGVALPLGIGLIAAGAASLGAGVALNWDTISEKVSEGLNTVAEKFGEFKQKVDEKLEGFKEIGQSIIDGFCEGITEFFNDPLGWIKEHIVDPFVQGFKDLFGIHSPSTVMKEIGDDVINGLLNGILEPIKNVGKWIKKNVIDPISKAIQNNPISEFVVGVKNTASEWWENAKSWWEENAGQGVSIEAAVSLAKKGWTTVKGWIGAIPTLSQTIGLIKSGWSTVKEWVGNIPVVNQAVSLIKSGWSTVKGWIGSIPIVDQGIQLVKSGWETVKGWIGNIPTLSQAISLIKQGWTTVKNWVGNIPTLDQAIQLVKQGWQTVRTWIGNIPTLDQAIALVKNGWTTVKNWVGNIPTLDQAIALIKSGWTTVKNWIGTIPTISQAISLAKSGWYTVSGWIGSLPAISQAITLYKSGWTSIANFVGSSVSVGISLWRNGWSSISSFIGTSVSVGISLFKSGWTSIKSFFGLSKGGTVGANGGVSFGDFASGGIITAKSFWNALPKYAGGTRRAHGSMFVAGEAGPEMVGHVNGTTEVLNRFQLGAVMHSSIVAGMQQFTPIWRLMNSQMVVSANAIIRSILVSAEAVNTNLANQISYDPTNSLAQTMYEESQSAYKNVRDNDSMAAVMRDFYREYVEPTLREIASDTKRQADKEEQTIVQIGNRTINDAVVTQQKANGFVFAK